MPFDAYNISNVVDHKTERVYASTILSVNREHDKLFMVSLRHRVNLALAYDCAQEEFTQQYNNALAWRFIH